MVWCYFRRHAVEVAGFALETVLVPDSGSFKYPIGSPFEHNLMALASNGPKRAIGIDQVIPVVAEIYLLVAREEVQDGLNAECDSRNPDSVKSKRECRRCGLK